MNMRILDSDYDGTLNYNGIDEEKKQALREWRNAGNVFALISGRGRQNGAVIMETDGSVLFEATCDGRPCRC